MSKLKVVKHEVLKGRLIVTVEKTNWFGLKKTIHQFIDSDRTFIHNKGEKVWLTYPDFLVVGFHPINAGECEFHEFLTGWKRKYEFQNK